MAAQELVVPRSMPMMGPVREGCPTGSSNGGAEGTAAEEPVTATAGERGPSSVGGAASWGGAPRCGGPPGPGRAVGGRPGEGVRVLAGTPLVRAGAGDRVLAG